MSVCLSLSLSVCLCGMCIWSSWLAFLCVGVKGWLCGVGFVLPSSPWFWKTNLEHQSLACAACSFLQCHHSDYCCDIFIHTHITSVHTHSLVPVNYFTILLLHLHWRLWVNVKQPTTYISYTVVFGMCVCVTWRDTCWIEHVKIWLI